MYCHNCGNEVDKNSVFCHKCGAKLIQDEAAAQEAAGPNPAVPASEEKADLGSVLKENMPACPAVKAVIQAKKGTVLKGSVRRYLVITGEAGQAFVAPSLAFPFQILDWITYGLIIMIVSSIAWDYMEYGSVYMEDYGWMFALSLLVGGLIQTITPFLGLKEKRDVLIYVREAAESKGVVLASPKGAVRVSAARLAVSVVPALVGAILLIFVAVDAFEIGGGGAASAADIDHPAETAVDNLALDLNQIYTNEAEGFSFRYPGDWKVRKDSTMVSLLAPAEPGDSAGIDIMKSDADETFFSATLSDLETTYSNSRDNLREMTLEDITLSGHSARKLKFSYTGEKGGITQIQYFYIINSDMYFVTCTAPEDRFDLYEPVFDAVMGSYTITGLNMPEEANADNSTEPFLYDESNSIFFVEEDNIDSGNYPPTLILHPDGNFTLLVNLFSDIGTIHGTYHEDGFNKIFNVTSRDFSGPGGEETDQFIMASDGDSYVYSSAQPIGITKEGSRFYYRDYVPDSMIKFAEEAGVKIDIKAHAESSSEISVQDLIGQYSYDASFTEPDGSWTNFYYFLEIGWVDSELVITVEWRGLYMFDHVRVSPDSLTGNQLIFEACEWSDDVLKTHTLTFIPASETPQGRDTIYIDGDESMPFVRE